MNAKKMENIPATALAACMLGLIVSPYFYIAFGALGAFPPAFSFIMLPPLILGSGFLFWRFLAKPNDTKRGILFLVFEGLGWLAVIAFVIFVSRINLLTMFERFGLSCAFFLVASICALPVVAFRKTDLECRLAQIPKSISVGILLLMLLISGLATIAYWLGTPAFI